MRISKGSEDQTNFLCATGDVVVSVIGIFDCETIGIAKIIALFDMISWLIDKECKSKSTNLVEIAWRVHPDCQFIISEVLPVEIEKVKQDCS